jgi:hypothetical protein
MEIPLNAQVECTDGICGRIRGQSEERPHYPFGDAGRAFVGTEGCDHSSGAGPESQY